MGTSKQEQPYTLSIQFVISVDIILNLSLRRKATSLEEYLESNKTSELTGVQPWLLYRNVDVRAFWENRNPPPQRLRREGILTSHITEHLSEVAVRLP